jgi:phage-related protein
MAYLQSSGKMILLHGFIKKSQKTPQADLQLAEDRKANLEKSHEQTHWQ